MKVSQMIELLRRFPQDAEVTPGGLNDDTGQWRYLIDMSQSSIAAGLSEDEQLCWLDASDCDLPPVLVAAIGSSFDY